jgi:hypothetical protein
MRNRTRVKLLLVLPLALGLVSCTTTLTGPTGPAYDEPSSRRMEVAAPAAPAPELDHGTRTQADSAGVGDGTGRGVFIGPGA